jgi:hypothetical protein
VSARIAHWAVGSIAFLTLAIAPVGAHALSPDPSGANATHGPVRLVGAWRLARIDTGEQKGELAKQPKGMLIYTADGHMSVQLMYPLDQRSLSNAYVLKGYEASFGTYTVDGSTVTHHVVGANTGDMLVGKDLRRHFQIDPHGNLVITPEDPKEHWSVTWARDPH